ncbi:MAG TPA: hypothetical protein PKD37_06675 [Oligoflexia bacterium]|nr:hypothetical protein [Oligoflexia bacterium]
MKSINSIPIAKEPIVSNQHNPILNVPNSQLKQKSLEGGFGEIFNKIVQESISLRSSRPGELADKAGIVGNLRELINFQIRVSQFGVKIEMLSRFADSLNSAVRKIQNAGQQ